MKVMVALARALVLTLSVPLIPSTSASASVAVPVFREQVDQLGCRWVDELLSVPMPVSEFVLLRFVCGDGGGGEKSGGAALFLHGHAGDAEQATALAAASTTTGRAAPVAWFAVSHAHSQSLSALDAHLLRRQAAFAAAALSHLALVAPVVSLVAHSMGSIAASAVLLLHPLESVKVVNLLLLAAPRMHPPVSIEWDMVLLYRLLNKPPPKPHSLPVIVSIAGGSRDLQIQSQHADLSNFLLTENSVSVYTSNVSGVWIDLPHDDLLTHQPLVNILVNAISDVFATVNPSSNQSDIQKGSIAIWRQYLLHEYPLDDRQIDLRDKIDIRDESVIVVTVKSLNFNGGSEKSFTALARNTIWAWACYEKDLSNCISITDQFLPTPTSTLMLKLDNQTLMRFTRLVFKTKNNDDNYINNSNNSNNNTIFAHEFTEKEGDRSQEYHISPTFFITKTINMEITHLSTRIKLPKISEAFYQYTVTQQFTCSLPLVTRPLEKLDPTILVTVSGTSEAKYISTEKTIVSFFANAKGGLEFQVAAYCGHGHDGNKSSDKDDGSSTMLPGNLRFDFKINILGTLENFFRRWSIGIITFAIITGLVVFIRELGNFTRRKKNFVPRVLCSAFIVYNTCAIMLFGVIFKNHEFPSKNSTGWSLAFFIAAGLEFSFGAAMFHSENHKVWHMFFVLLAHKAAFMEEVGGGATFTASITRTLIQQEQQQLQPILPQIRNQASSSTSDDGGGGNLNGILPHSGLVLVLFQAAFSFPHALAGLQDGRFGAVAWWLRDGGGSDSLRRDAVVVVLDLLGVTALVASGWRRERSRVRRRWQRGWLFGDGGGEFFSVVVSVVAAVVCNHVDESNSAKIQMNLFSHDNESLNTAPPSTIPIIDFAAFSTSSSGDDDNGATVQEKQAVAQELVHAFRTAGFVYLRNHGIPEGDVARIFEASKAFFALDQSEKDKISWESPESNRGYVALGRELSFIYIYILHDINISIIVRKLTELDKEGRVDDIKALNEISPDLKEALGSNAMQKLNLIVMSVVAEGLGLEKNFFTQFIDKSNNTLRLLHYPRVPANQVNDRSRRCGAHSDYGGVTFLFQDQVGGLEVKERGTNAYVRATPIPDTVLVNVGDLLQRWTNDYLVSTEHRVVQPYQVETDGYLPARYSVVYFCDPNTDAQIESLEQFVENGQTGYEPVNAGEYLLSRLSST
ncbi:hypothetical protein HK100_011676, partial [Physocladia obscura]